MVRAQLEVVNELNKLKELRDKCFDRSTKTINFLAVCDYWKECTDPDLQLYTEHEKRVRERNELLDKCVVQSAKTGEPAVLERVSPPK